MVSVDTVYQKVLALANKEQRGYITPQDFNLFANQAQMEIFEQYFYDTNIARKSQGNDTVYADVDEMLEEKIQIFDDHSEIIIDDNGPGIPRDKREEVVLPFTRLENSRNSKTGGTGLGLSIAKNAALSHGGELILDESPLGGLRVRFLLPL